MNRDSYSQAFPGSFFLDPDDLDALQEYLHRVGWLPPGERLRSAARAGEGNMNCVVRAVPASGGAPFILKQSRPWVEKYPVIAAPRDRAQEEARFYQLVADTPAVAGRMPRLLGVDAEARLLLLEDLGPAGDCFPCYQPGEKSLDGPTMDTLADYLAALHAIPKSPAARLVNREMRALNHTHIFDLPLRPGNGLDLDAYTPGLAAAAAPLLADAEYVSAVRALGERYRHGDDGPTLIHGDFFPGSWLLGADRKLWVIDPEFAFHGDAAFDLSTTLAHLLLAGQDPALAGRFLARYPRLSAPEEETAWRLAGVEIMRRLIGVAQLPIPPDLARKQRLLALSRRLVLAPASGREQALAGAL